VNAIAWAPHEYGLILGCASADGTISILTHQVGATAAAVAAAAVVVLAAVQRPLDVWRLQDDDSWSVETIPDGTRLGCNAISWAPITAYLSEQPTGSCALFIFGAVTIPTTRECRPTCSAQIRDRKLRQ
jgi:protein transport protein SEC13